MARLASSVVALEEDGALSEKAAATLATLGVDNVAVVTGPLPAPALRAATAAPPPASLRGCDEWAHRHAPDLRCYPSHDVRGA
jgi:hypothetical protein